MPIILLRTGRETKVSQEDLAFLSQWAWSLNNAGYARSSKGYMHRIILERMGVNMQNLHTDHINRDKLDNRRSNLRAVTASENNKKVWIARRTHFGPGGGQGPGQGWTTGSVKKSWETRRKLYGPSGRKKG